MRPAAGAAALALVLVLAACWTERAPRPPRTSSTPVPGTLWVTPAQPWRVGVQASRIAVAGATAMLASGGWIARFDLERGAIARERRLPDFAIEQLVALPGGRWLLAGLRGRRAIVATLDAVTLAPTIVVTGGERPEGDTSDVLHGSSRAVVLDEGIALAGEGQLAIYDPATWQVRRVLDPRAGWRWVAGAGQTLYASGAQELARFDLATGAREKIDLPRFTYRVDATATHLVTYASERSRWRFDAEGRGARTRIAVGDRDAAIDRAGDRIAIRDRTTIHVHALAGGRRLGSYELGESGHGRLSAMAFDGGRLIVMVSGILRVIDLATGAITPAGEPPYDAGRLAVNVEGEVLSVGMHALRVVGGEVAASARIGFDEAAAGDPHQVGRYGVIRKPDERRVEVHELGARAPIGSWRLEDTADTVWLGRTGNAVIDTSGVHAQRALFRGAGASLERLTPLKFESLVHDVDVDGGYALVGVEGTAHLVRLRGAEALHALPHPSCEQYASGRLERGGDRVILNDGANVAVYRRSTGALVGSATIDEAAEETIVFVPGRDEILIAASDALVLWDPLTGALRRLGGLAGLAEAQVSPDARRVALAFQDGRIALADLDALRAAMTPGRADPLPAEAKKAECPSGDPFELDPDHQKDPEAEEDP